MAISDWPARWRSLQNACEFRKATGRWAEGKSQPPRFDISPPATERDVLDVEKVLGCAIPSSFRTCLRYYSASTQIEWALPQNTKLPDVFRHVFSGECRWQLSSLVDLQKNYHSWLKIFTNPADKYDGPWQQKFPILEVGNGDMLGIDIAQDVFQPVVYLSHEGDDSVHGYWLGRDFQDYIDRLSLLGCVGSEDWQLLPFVSGPKSFLETDGVNAKLWRDWFGLNPSTHGVLDQIP